MAQLLETQTPLTVTTSGTRVEFTATATPVQSVIFQADPANTNDVYIGDVTVTTANGIALSPGQTLAIHGDERKGWADEVWMSDFYADSDANGNKVRWAFLKARN